MAFDHFVFASSGIYRRYVDRSNHQVTRVWKFPQILDVATSDLRSNGSRNLAHGSPLYKSNFLDSAFNRFSSRPVLAGIKDEKELTYCD
jgi:hypothetical protein